jgi:hypothetical protein
MDVCDAHLCVPFPKIDLLLLGPGSFLEVRKILPSLTANVLGQPSFHVVTFSLPGTGFSEGVKKKGFELPQYAKVCFFVTFPMHIG